MKLYCAKLKDCSWECYVRFSRKPTGEWERVGTGSPLSKAFMFGQGEVEDLQNWLYDFPPPENEQDFEWVELEVKPVRSYDATFKSIS